MLLPLEIPDRYQTGIEKIAALNEESITDLLKVLHDFPPSQRAEQLPPAVVSKMQPIDAEEMSNIVQLLISLRPLTDTFGWSAADLLQGIRQAAESAQFHEPSNPQQQSIQSLFQTLVKQWHRETAMLSSITQKSMHPAYQRIIGLGKPVIPLILHELEREPNHWFWALTAITGEDPISPDDNFDRAVDAWLTWGREEGLLN